MYYIMPRYGPNLHSLFAKAQHKMTKDSALKIGLKVLRHFEKIHRAGFIYNDLKLDNVLVNFDFDSASFSKSFNKDKFDDIDVNLIDFGFLSRYRDEKTGEHICEGLVEFFRGNFMFSSHAAMKFKKTSRRDDLISLLYLIVFMMKKGQINGLKPANEIYEMEMMNGFESMQKGKANHTPESILGTSKTLKCLQ